MPTEGDPRHPGLAAQVRGWDPAPDERADRLEPGPARGLADLLRVDPGERTTAGLPVLWHWVYWLDWPPLTALGPDGHPVGAGFQPPLADRRRMFAGGRCVVESPLQLGVRAEVRRSLLRAQVKQGRTGELLLVTVGSQVSQDGRACVHEEQDFVYRSGPAAERGDGARPVSPDRSAPVAGDRFCADPVLLFRFSALTANSHRIHYDHPYATEVEGYPGLVVHGPLLALLMAERAHRATGRRVRSLDYRFQRPAFAGEHLHVTAEADHQGARLSVLGPSGDVRASGTALLHGDGS